MIIVAKQGKHIGFICCLIILSLLIVLFVNNAFATKLPTSEIRLRKTSSPSRFTSAGQTINYFYNVVNTGRIILTNVTVTDAQPGLSPISCPTSILTPGESETCTASYTTTQADLDAGHIRNIGVASGQPFAGLPVIDISLLTVPAVVSARMNLVKSSSPTSVSSPGQTITYSYLVSNDGNVTISNISVLDFHRNLSPISCPTTTLAPGASQTCTATYITTQEDVNNGKIQNTGIAIGRPASGLLPLTDISSLTIPVVVTPRIALVKSASPTNFSDEDQTITYSYFVVNSGNVTLNRIDVTDRMLGLSRIDCPRSELLPGESETCIATYKTRRSDVDAGSITNTGTASGNPPQGRTISDNSTVTIPLVNVTSLLLTKSATPIIYSGAGQTISYSYLVTNKSNVTLSNIAVNDPHAGLSAITCPQPSLAPDQSETCTATYTTTSGDVSAGTITNTAIAQGEPPVGPVIISAPSTMTVYAVPSPELTISKTSSPTSFSSPGVLITYSYLVSNQSNVTLTNVSVTDPHSGLSPIFCPLSTLPPGASETCVATYTTTQADVDAESIQNTSTASGTPPLGPDITASSTLTVPAVVNGDIRLTKTSSLDNFSTPGEVITYSYIINNSGNTTLTDVTVIDPQVGLSSISCPTTTLAPGATETCTATYTTTQDDVNAGSVTNTSITTGKTLAGATVADSSALTVPAIVSPSISLNKTSSPTNFSAPGVVLTYSYLVTNAGNVPLTSITVTDPQPGLSAISCPTTTLAPAASQTCTATYTTTQADINTGSIQNTATASGTPPIGQAVIVDSTLTVPAIVTPSIVLTKSSSPTSISNAGELVTYSYLVNNNGNVPLINVTVTDPHPGLSAIACPVTILPPGASQTCTATYTTTQTDLNAGRIQNTGTASGTPPSGPAISNSSTLTIPALVNPGISLTKTSSPSNFSTPGVLINYFYLVTNTGNVTLTSVAVTDPHTGLSAISCPSPTLAPGASETCTATYTTTQPDVDAGGITNTGTAAGTPPSGSPVTDDSTLTVPATISSSIALIKSSSPTSFSTPGELINYSYLVTNTGNATLTNIMVADNHTGLSAISCPATTLAPGAAETCTATYTITQNDINAGSITNIGTVSGRTPQGSIVTDASVVTIPAVVVTDLALTKSASPTIFTTAGQLITYSYLVTNNSNVTLTNITVNDPLSGLSAISCPMSSLAPNASETCTATYSTTQADVNAGRITNIATASGTPPSGPAIISAPSIAIVFGVAAPQISLAKTSSPTNFSSVGVLITYSYLVTNTSHVTLNNIVVTDPHTGLSPVSCPVSSLAPGASETCTATYTTTQADLNAGKIENTSTATGITTLGTSVSSDSTLTIPGIVNANITLSKSSSPTVFSNVGEVITYAYLVTNTGNVTLSNIGVTDPHTGLSAISCPSSTLLPGASETCTATYTTTQADLNAGNITNTGTATGTSPLGSTVTDDAILTLPANISATITVSKTSSPTRYSSPGVLITYSYLVTNNGNVPLTNVTVTDPQPDLSAISCPANTLAPGASETCTATYITKQTDMEAGRIRNTSTASGLPPIGPAISDNSTLTVPAYFGPGISLTKSASPSNFISAGETITYSYFVTNESNVTLSSITVNDAQPGLSPVSCPLASLAPGASETCTATYITTSNDVSRGRISSIAVATGVPLFGPVATSLPATVILDLVQAGSITVIKLAAGGDATFNFNSTITGVDNFTLTTNKGKAQKTFPALNPGNYTVTETNLPAGWRFANLHCNGVKMNGPTANISLSPNQHVICTFINVLENAVVQKTQEKIRTFLNNRANLILLNAPDRRRIIERLSEHSLSQAGFVPYFSEGRATLAITSSLNRFLPAYIASNIDVWTEAHLAYFDDHLDSRHNHTGQFGIVYLGSDYLFLPSVLGGILLEIDIISENSNFENACKASGTGWMVGPYLSARLLPNLYLHTRAAWGESKNSINPFGFYDDHFNTSRSLYNAEITGNWVRNGFRVSPSVGISYYNEKQQSYINAVNIFIPSQNIYLGQLNFGPEFGYEYITYRRLLIAPRLRLQGLYSFNQSSYSMDDQVFSPNKISALIELGAEIRFPIGLRIYPLLGYSGIGNNLHSIQGQLQFDFML